MLGTRTMLWPPLIYHGLSLSIGYLHFSHMQNIHLLSRPPKISSNMAATQCSEYISSSGSGLDVNEVAWVQLFSVWKLRDLKIHYLSPSLHPPPEPHLCVRKRGGLTAIDSPIPRGRKPRARGRHRSLTFLKRSHAPKAGVPRAQRQGLFASRVYFRFPELVPSFGSCVYPQTPFSFSTKNGLYLQPSNFSICCLLIGSWGPRAVFSF